MNLSEYFERNRGKQAEMSKVIGIAQAFLSAVSLGKRTMPAKYCSQVEKFTNSSVTRKDLRPHDYHLIWPELAEKESQK